MGCAEPRSLHRPSPGKEEGPGPGQWAVALTQTASSWSLPLRAGAAGSEDGRSSVLSALRQKLLGGRSKRATPALTAMAKVEWLLAPWHRAGKAGSRAGLRWVVGAVGSASAADLILHSRTPGWGQLLGTDPLEALQYPWGQCCAAVPVLCHLSQTDLSCGEFMSLLNLSAVPQLSGVSLL